MVDRKLLTVHEITQKFWYLLLDYRTSPRKQGFMNNIDQLKDITHHHQVCR